MLQVTAPIELNIRSQIVGAGEGFCNRITANYNMINTEVAGEQMLHVTTQPPEYYFGSDGDSVVNNSTNINIEEQNNIEIVNNLINRIMVEPSFGLIYQDRVYISNALRKLGIKNEQLFMKQIYNMRQDVDQTRELIDMYWSYGDSIKYLIDQYVDQSDRSKSSTENVDQTYPLTLHETIYNRLQTGAVYSIVQNFHHNAYGHDVVSTNEMFISEQKKVYENILLKELKNDVRSEKLPLVYKNDNYYENYNFDEENTTDENITEVINAASLLSFINNAYEAKSEELRNNVNIWYEVRPSISNNSSNTLVRLESHVKNEGVSTTVNMVRNVEENNKLLKNEISILNDLFSRTDYQENINNLSLIYKNEDNSYKETDLYNENSVINRHDTLNQEITNRTLNDANLNNTTIYSENIVNKADIQYGDSVENNNTTIVDNNTTITNNKNINENVRLNEMITNHISGDVDQDNITNYSETNISSADIRFVDNSVDEESTTIEGDRVSRINELIHKNTRIDENSVHETTERTEINTSVINNENVLMSTDIQYLEKTVEGEEYDPLKIENNYRSVERKIEKLRQQNIDNVMHLEERVTYEGDINNTRLDGVELTVNNHTDLTEENIQLSEYEQTMLLQKQLNQNNSVNIANEQRLSQTIQAEREKLQRTLTPQERMERQKRDSLMALSNPQEIIMNLRQEQIVADENDRQIRQKAIEQTIIQGDQISVLINEYMKNPNIEIPGVIVTHDDIGGLASDIERVELLNRQNSQEYIENNNTIERISREISKEIVEDEAGSLSVSKTREHIDNINLIHRTVENTVMDEVTEQLMEQNRILQERSFEKDEVVVSKNVNNSKVINENVFDKTEINKNIEEVVNNSIGQKMNVLSDQIYRKIESKLELEKRRRGF